MVTMPGCEEFPTLEVEGLARVANQRQRDFKGRGSAGEEDQGSWSTKTTRSCFWTLMIRSGVLFVLYEMGI